MNGSVGPDGKHFSYYFRRCLKLKYMHLTLSQVFIKHQLTLSAAANKLSAIFSKFGAFPVYMKPIISLKTSGSTSLMSTRFWKKTKQLMNSYAVLRQKYLKQYCYCNIRSASNAYLFTLLHFMFKHGIKDRWSRCQKSNKSVSHIIWASLHAHSQKQMTQVSSFFIKLFQTCESTQAKRNQKAEVTFMNPVVLGGH